MGEAITRLNVKVILSIREDYLHHLLEFRNVSGMDWVTGGDILGRSILYEIGNFSPNDARAIIEYLMTIDQFILEPALIERVVSDLAVPLGEIRPIELQLVGAQLRTAGIQKLEQYPLEGKIKLITDYWFDIVKNCGQENERLAFLVAYLLTDERGRRPIKTKKQIEDELEEALPEIDESRLDLVLIILTKSGLVAHIQDSLGDRYQLIYDYLVDVIRGQQQPQLNKVIAALEMEQEKRRSLELRLAATEKIIEELWQWKDSFNK